MKRSRSRCLSGLGCLLLAGMLFTGCGQGQGSGQQGQQPQNQSQQGQQTNQNQQGQEQPGKAINALAHFISVDKNSLFAGSGTSAQDVGQLLKISCLATENGTFTAGTRKNQGTPELAIYQTRQNQKPELAASYPDEMLLSWCDIPGGIAFLSTRTVQSEEDTQLHYTLRTLEAQDGAPLQETNSWSLTDCIEEQGGKPASGYCAMALRENTLVLADRDNILAADLSTGTATCAIPTNEATASLRYVDENTVWVLTERGTLYTLTLPSGSKKVQAEKMFDQTEGARQGCAIGTSQIYVSSGGKLYAVDIKDGKTQKLADYEFSRDDYGSLWAREGDNTLAQGNLALWNESSLEVYQYLFSPAGSVSGGKDDREIILLENYHVDDQLKKAARKFNQSNLQYWVEVVDGQGEDYDSYRDRFNARLVSGQGPDLMIYDEDLTKNYMAKGIYENLAPLIQQHLNPADYLQSVLYAYAEDGFVYAMGSNFGLDVMLTKKQWADSAGKMSLWEVFRMAEASGVPTFLKGLETERLLYWCLSKADNAIFDMEKVRECILFAQQYGDPTQEYSYNSPIAIGEDAIMETESIRNPLDIPDIERYYGNLTDLVITGIPLNEMCRPILTTYSNAAPLCINAASGHKEGAWAFIQYLLEEEYQFSITDSFPVRKNAFDAMLTSYLIPRTYDVYIDQLGEIMTVTDAHTLKRCLQAGIPDKIDAVEEAQMERLRNLVEQAVICNRTFDAELIIGEEAAYYYGGGKTLDQVMEVIESRLTLYQAVQ